MRIIAFLTVALVLLAAGLQLYYLQHDQLAALLKLFLSLPLPQQAAWAMILTAPVLLFFAGLWGYGRMQQRKQSRALATQITNLQAAQKNNEDAAKYLDRIDSEQDVSDLRRRLSETEHLIDHHDGRNQSADLAAGIEQVREQQEALWKRLGGVIAERTSIEGMVGELRKFQGEAEQAIARMEEGENGDTLEARLHKLLEFGRDANVRCGEIEQSLQGIHGQEKEFDTLQTRLAPLVDFEGGVCNRLRLLQDTRAKLTSDLEGIERDDGIPLAERVQQIDEARSGLEQRVSEAKLRCEEIERALQGLMHQQMECDAIKSRLAPLVDSETGIRPRLRILQDTHAELIGSLEGVEHENGVPLAERVQEFADSRSGLEQRVSALLEQVTKIETVQLEISALFAKLNQAHRVSRELESNIRVVAQAG
jgi:DNA repair exonuclease SbcCD ATPase subunit